MGDNWNHGELDSEDDDLEARPQRSDGDPNAVRIVGGTPRPPAEWLPPPERSSTRPSAYTPQPVPTRPTAYTPKRLPAAYPPAPRPPRAPRAPATPPPVVQRRS